MCAQIKYGAEHNNNLNCIWIGSGYSPNHPCEKDFDCVSCPVDIIFRNLGFNNKNSDGSFQLGDTSFIEKIISRIDSSEFQSNLIYLKNNFLLKHLYANIYYLGLNPAVSPLVDNISSIKEYMKRVYLSKGDKLLSIEGEWGKIEMEAPLSFLILDKINWTPEEFSSNKWIALAVVNQDEIDESKISHEEWNIEKLRIKNNLEEFRNFCLEINEALGMKNEKLNYLFQLLGKDEYKKSLNSLFNTQY